jgi:hypothetical protein
VRHKFYWREYVSLSKTINLTNTFEKAEGIYDPCLKTLGSNKDAQEARAARLATDFIFCYE